MDFFGLISHFLQGASIGFIASVPLGPIGILCIQRTLNKGRRSGFVSGLGAATSDLLYAIIAGFSVSFVMKFVEEQKTVLEFIAAGVLIFIGIRIFRTNPVVEMRRRQQQQIRSRKLEEQMGHIAPNYNKGYWKDYFSTFFLTVTNPLALFLFLGAFSIVGGERTVTTQILLLLGVFCGAATWWLTLTVLVGLFRRKLTMRRLYYINKVAGSIIIALVVIGLIAETVKLIFF